MGAGSIFALILILLTEFILPERIAQTANKQLALRLGSFLSMFYLSFHLIENDLMKNMLFISSILFLLFALYEYGKQKFLKKGRVNNAAGHKK